MEGEYFCGREDTTNNKVRVSYKNFFGSRRPFGVTRFPRAWREIF